jgi:V8-like Glu-specific endopeptidase
MKHFLSCVVSALFLLLTTSICVLLLTTSICVAQAQLACGPGDIMVRDTDESTQQCRAAFCALPEQDRFGVPFFFSDFARHVSEQRNLFRRFLQSCYTKLDGEGTTEGLQSDTKSLIMGVYGGLFQRIGNNLVLKCSSFRIAKTIIVTARHCIYDNPNYQPFPDQFVFRSIALPSEDVQIIGELPNQAGSRRSEIANDFDDYWYLITDEREFSLSPAAFRKDYPRRARALVSGINLIAYVLESGADPNQWASAFRFSITTGAQWLHWEDLPHALPSENAKARCIFHKGSSFGGMSGAPIIGEEHALDGSRALFVFGMHLRTGVPDQAHLLDADCGTYPGFNVGLALPDHLLQHIQGTKH